MQLNLWNLQGCIAIVPLLLDLLYGVSAVLRANILDTPSPQVVFVVKRAVLPAHKHIGLCVFAWLQPRECADTASASRVFES